MKRFDGRVAAITGAASGMGRSLAFELARRGCHLALSDVDEAGLRETTDRARELGHGRSVVVTSQRVDVADRSAVFAWAEQVVADHGRVNLVFNNAGVALSATVEGMSYTDIEWLMGINFWGVVHGTKAFLPHLRASGEGHIVNTSSVFGLLAVPSQSAYNAAKFAVRGFTESLRQELDMLDCGVSATSVHPGGIQTRIAQSARNDASVRALGMDETTAAARFEKSFMTTADRAALVILRGVARKQRRILVGPDAYAIDWLVRLAPSLYQRLVTTVVRKTSKPFAPPHPTPLT